MDKVQFENITKKAFEEKVLQWYEYGKIRSRAHYEMAEPGEKPTRVDLYYYDDTHIGSWCKRKGWIS